MSMKFFVAVLAASLFAFLGGWLLFGVVFSNYYASHINTQATVIMKTPPQMWAIAIGNIAWALLLTWILARTGTTNFTKAFVTSLWVSFLIILSFDLSIYGFWNIYSINFVLMDIVVSSVFWAFVGGVAGAVLGSGKKVVPGYTWLINPFK